MSVLNKLRKNSTIKGAELVSKSKFFKDADLVDTGIPALNIILSGRPDGGFGNGLISVAAPRAHFKTLLCLKMVQAYLSKYPESACIFYDSEYGGNLDYMISQGIDIDRVLHSPIDSIESLKFDMAKQLDELEEDDKVIFLIDSIGMLASNKETTDALNQKSVSDMTKAKEFASLARLITPKLNVKGVPCIAVNHVYKDISSMYGGNINSGGEKLQYAANTIIHISKSKERDGKELIGHTFKLIANKSRYVKEGSIVPLVVNFEHGVDKWSGLFDLAITLGWITVPKQGWYLPINKETGELLFDSNKRRKELENDSEFWKMMLSLGLSDDIYNHLSLTGSGSLVDTDDLDSDDDVSEIYSEEDNEY